MITVTKEILDMLDLPDDVRELLESAKIVVMPQTKAGMIEMALGGRLGERGSDEYEVSYDVPEKGRVVEAVVHRVRNGISINYPEPYMRRRDPSCMLIADDYPTNKRKYADHMQKPFGDLRGEIFEWLKTQSLVLLPFYSGHKSVNIGSVLIAPLNATFFAAGLAEIQGIASLEDIKSGFTLRSITYVTPHFRHTDCDGKQVVVHNRSEKIHEIFSLNLYPGPSAKKGIYGVLINAGEKEGWVTAHASAVVVTTPYDNDFVMMHEGASGGGKSEMLQYPHRQPDGRLLLAESVETGKQRFIPLFQGCTLQPITDDMALCNPQIQNNSGKLSVQDAEEGWFVRVDHITGYGVDRNIEHLCVTPPEPLVFFNIYSQPNATCLIWEPIEDEPGKPCPNPRVIIPRKIVPGIYDEPVEVDMRSFGVRTPPCTREKPTYGIVGVLHLLPAALGWLWRMASPRGFANPSIVDTKGMSSEGVGSYWPFCTGRYVDQANLLLKQIRDTPKTRYCLTPNQHIGAWKLGFMPQWIAREYIARRGLAKFKESQIVESRCALLGYALQSMQIDGFFLNKGYLQVELQEEVGPEAYDIGAKQLTEFFKSELQKYLEEPDLDPTARKIIDCCMQDGSVKDYQDILGF